MRNELYFPASPTSISLIISTTKWVDFIDEQNKLLDQSIAVNEHQNLYSDVILTDCPQTISRELTVNRMRFPVIVEMVISHKIN